MIHESESKGGRCITQKDTQPLSPARLVLEVLSIHSFVLFVDVNPTQSKLI